MIFDEHWRFSTKAFFPGHNEGATMKRLLETLNETKNTLPTKQRKLCEYIIENGRSVYLMSVGSLADAAGVGRATVIRLVESLGFESYVDFKKALNASYFIAAEGHYNSNPFFWMDDAGTELSDEKDSINACCGESMRILQQARRELDREQFGKIVDILISAWRVNVLGLRTSAPIARYASYMLGYLTCSSFFSFFLCSRQTLVVKIFSGFFRAALPLASQPLLVASRTAGGAS